MDRYSMISVTVCSHGRVLLFALIAPQFVFVFLKTPIPDCSFCLLLPVLSCQRIPDLNYSAFFSTRTHLKNHKSHRNWRKYILLLYLYHAVPLLLFHTDYFYFIYILTLLILTKTISEAYLCVAECVRGRGGFAVKVKSRIKMYKYCTLRPVTRSRVQICEEEQC